MLATNNVTHLDFNFVTDIVIMSPTQSCFNNHKDLVALEKEAALKKVNSGTQVDFHIAFGLAKTATANERVV